MNIILQYTHTHTEQGSWEVTMEKAFFCGLVLGGICGMLIVANSNKAKKLITDSQKEIKKKVDEISENCSCGGGEKEE